MDGASAGAADSAGAARVRYAVGLALLLMVVVLWVASSELTEVRERAAPRALAWLTRRPMAHGAVYLPRRGLSQAVLCDVPVHCHLLVAPAGRWRPPAVAAMPPGHRPRDRGCCRRRERGGRGRGRGGAWCGGWPSAAECARGRTAGAVGRRGCGPRRPCRHSSGAAPLHCAAGRSSLGGCSGPMLQGGTDVGG
jgi:hypothetical protein